MILRTPWRSLREDSIYNHSTVFADWYCAERQISKDDMASLLVLYASIRCADSSYIFVDVRSPELARYTSLALNVLRHSKARKSSEWSYP